MMAEILSNPLMLGFYIVGIISATFHLANGIMVILSKLGYYTISRSQQIATYVTLIIFLVLSVVGVQAILSIRLRIVISIRQIHITIKLRGVRIIMAKSKVIVVGGG